MLSSQPGMGFTAAGLVLDVVYPGIDDDTNKDSREQLYIPYHIPPSKNVFVRGLCASESMKLYVFQMSSETERSINNIIVGSGEPICLTSVMPLYSATTVSTMVANDLIAPLTQLKEDLPTSIVSYMVAQPLHIADVW